MKVKDTQEIFKRRSGGHLEN